MSADQVRVFDKHTPVWNNREKRQLVKECEPPAQ